MRARFGTAGNPEGFYAAGKKQSKQMPGWLRERGLDAYEYQCGKGVTVGEATARASQFHSHFSKIAYTPRGGEARHLTFDQPDFGPDPAPLCEALARRGWSPRVICESAGTQDVDALWMKGAYLRALGETAEG